MGVRAAFGTWSGGRSGVTGLVLAAAIAATSFLGGCSNVSKKQYDAAMQENAELRERNAQLEQSVREKDMQLAAKPSPVDLVAPPVSIGSNDGGFSRGSLSSDADFRPDSEGGVTATLSGEVLFDSGSATLKASARQSLDRIAGTLKSRYSGRNIRVAGHTDSDPIRRSKWSSNDALSQARADAVMKYLVSKGVPAGRIQAMGYGSSRPKSSKAASRRVEIQVLR